MFHSFEYLALQEQHTDDCTGYSSSLHKHQRKELIKHLKIWNS